MHLDFEINVVCAVGIFYACGGVEEAIVAIDGGKGGAMGLQPHLISECSIGF